MSTSLYELVDIISRSVMVGVAASITVGPVAVLCIQRTLSKSRRAGFMSGVGVATADALMAIVAYFFYAVLQRYIEMYDYQLRVIGGLLIVGVGIYIFAQNPVTQIRKNRVGKSSSWQDFASIFGITLANFLIVIPYILAFFAMFNISSTDGIDLSNLFGGVVVIAGFYGGAMLWWTLFTGVISLLRSRFKPRHMLTVNRVAGGLISLLGVSTVLSIFIS
ncbi:MAG: LysE family transporter [Rikenellaceae bacterium]